MKYLFISSLILALLPTPGPACDSNDFDLTVPINVQFEQQQFRQPWIYRSLEPRLMAPQGNFQLHATKVDNETLRLEFCGKSSWIDGVTSLELLLASRRLRLTARPVHWQETESHRVGSMTQIWVADLPDPDWVVVQSVRVLPESDQEAALLEITLVNFTSFESSHDVLVLSSGGASVRGLSCMESAPRYQETYLDFLQVHESKGDDSWTTLGDRRIQVSFNVTSRCGYHDAFSAEVPIQVQVAPHRTERIILRLINGRVRHKERRSQEQRSLLQGLKSAEDRAKEPAAAARELDVKDLRTWWERWPELTVAVRGMQIFPKNLPVGERQSRERD